MAANQFLDWLLGKDVETSVIEGLAGYDPHLDEAIKNVVAEEGFEDEEEEQGYFEDEDH
jgi:hypothetical protein